jgi:HAD superfamily hydrolase (TIGR01549 family)
VVLFDLDGTLRINQPSYNDGFFDHAVRLGLPDGREKRLSASRWVHRYWAQSPELMQDLQDYQDLDFWLHYTGRTLEAFGCPLERVREFAPEIFRYMNEDHCPQDTIPADVPKTLQVLKEAGYRLGVISNRSSPFGDYLEEIGLGGFFELTLAAIEVASWKPDPEIFIHALERMGECPEGVIYIGDNYYADVVGAQRAGLQAVLIDPEGVFPDADCPVICAIGELQAIAARPPGRCATPPAG